MIDDPTSQLITTFKLISWTIAIPCVVGRRLLLNIRERVFEEKMVSLSTLTTIF
jgi:hypothetical protein